MGIVLSLNDRSGFYADRINNISSRQNCSLGHSWHSHLASFGGEKRNKLSIMPTKEQKTDGQTDRLTDRQIVRNGF